MSLPNHQTSPPNNLTIEAATALIDPLSARHQDVLGTIALGLSIKDMAKEYFLAEATIKSHSTRIYTELGVGSSKAAREITGTARYLQGIHESEDEGIVPITRQVIEKHDLSLEELTLMDHLRLRIHDLKLLKLAAEGKTNREISEAFFVEESTLKSRKSELYKRLGQRRVKGVVRSLSTFETATADV